SWSRIGPPPVANAAMAFDPTANETVVFGGVSWQFPPGTSAVAERSNQTWIYRDGTWHNATVAGVPTPSPRSDAAFAEDPAVGGLLLFGGLSQNGSALGDTWIYANGSWKALANLSLSPSARWGASLAYNVSGRYLLLFGGRNATGYLGDTFEFASNRWTQTMTSRAPSPRSEAGLAYDAGSSGGLILFGGTNESIVSPSPAFSDTWSFGPTGWVQRHPATAPPNRTATALTADPSLGGLILVGGTPSPSLVPDQLPPVGFNDTWVYVNGTWSELTASGALPPLFGAAATYDPSSGGFLLFGGVNLEDRAPSPDMRWFGIPSSLTETGSAVPPQTDVGRNVTLAVTPSGGIGPYFIDWNYGDGSVSNGSTSIHAYRHAGEVNATALIVDSAGQSSWYRVMVTIHPDPTVGSVLVTPPLVEVGWPTRLQAQFTGGTAPFSIAWEFGDGLRGTGNPVLHQFPLIETASVTVWVNDSVGMSAVGHAAVVVDSMLSVQPLASPTVTDVGVAVEFTAAARGGVPPVNYSWNFDDGTVAPGQYVSHAFNSPGNYSVELWGNDSVGVLATSRVQIRVVGPPVVTIAARPSDPRVGTPITLTANISGGVGPYSVDWNFEDGTQSIGSGTAQYAYTSPGQYRVVATAIDSLGVRGMAFLLVNVSAAQNSTQVIPHTGSSAGSDVPWLLLTLGAGAGVALIIVGVVIYRRRVG
ncbi:MAG: PKD domain-containing protein, partial [Thermoplasmata archaeon]